MATGGEEQDLRADPQGRHGGLFAVKHRYLEELLEMEPALLVSALQR